MPEVPQDHLLPPDHATALVTIQLVFTDAERLALAAFLAGSRGLTCDGSRVTLGQMATRHRSWI